MRVLAALPLFFVALAGAAEGPPALETARALFARYHEDLRDLDRARDLLQAAPERDADANLLAALARAWFLIGEFRARDDAERVAAYERGREAGRRAVALAPRSEAAHVWHVLNSARAAETRGFVRAAGALPAIREEAQTILSLNPASVEGNSLAGGLAAELPRMLGGDRTRAEAHFQKALEADPRSTGVRVELARLYIATRRWRDAQRELLRVLDEPAPSDRPYWTLRDMPRARTLLDSIAARVEPRESP